MADIFLSYRRDDSRSATGRLADGLQAVFGAGEVFRDLDSIGPGQDFEAALARAVGGARVLLAVVGPRWSEVRDAGGRRRLDDPADVVRRELEAALAAGLPVLPILVEGAAMPAPTSLPASLAPFARCQAMPLHDTSWRDDVARLASVLQRQHGLEAGLEPGLGATATQRAGAALFDGLELLGRPRRVVLRLAGAGGRDALARAALLLVAALALGNVLLGLGLGFGPASELVSWTLNGIVLGLVASAFATAVLALGWRIAGVAVGWQRVASGAACLVGGAWLYVAVGLMCVALGLSIVDPGVFATLRARWRSGDPDATSHALGAMRGAALGGIVVANAIWLAGSVWLVAAWRGLRVAFGARGWQALLAALVTGGLLVGLVRLTAWAAG